MARSSVSIAMSTPAQKPRGSASKMRMQSPGRVPVNGDPSVARERAPARAPATPSADVLASTRALAQRHAENFPVLSIFLPRRLRQDFANVYAFCRAADDLADEGDDPAQRRVLLAAWREELRQCFAGAPSHPYFVALQSTVRRHELAIEPFEHLLDAFD